MRELLQNSYLHVKTVFNFRNALFSVFVLAATCYLNYSTSFRLWPTHLSGIDSFLWLTLLFLFFQLAGYLLITKNIYGSEGKYRWLLIAAPVFFAAKITIPISLFSVTNKLAFFETAFSRPAAWLGGFAVITISILLVHRLYEGRAGFYYVAKTNHVTIYILMLAIMLPLIVSASSLESFREVYPKSRILDALLYNKTSWKHYVFFETAYVFDFLSIELFFRGLLIATLSRLLGVHCILPVAFFYFSIHLGKPVQEAISSFFGGLFLGSLSYQTKSIWGGFAVHAGIALMMELFASLF